MDNKFYIDEYNPYVDLVDVRDSEYFEQKVLEYLETYKTKIDNLKDSTDTSMAHDIENETIRVIKLRNDEEIERILYNYLLNWSKRERTDNEAAIVKLRSDIRVVKDIILAVEPVDMKRLQDIDYKVDKMIDKVSRALDVSANVEFDGVRLNKLLGWFRPTEYLDMDEYTEYVLKFKCLVEQACEHYRKNYSVKTAVKYINDLIKKMEKILDYNALELFVFEEDKRYLRDLISMYTWDINSGSFYDKWLRTFNDDVEAFKIAIESRYSKKMADQMLAMVSQKTGELKDEVAIRYGLSGKFENRLNEIFDSFNPSDLNMFLELYPEDCERKLVSDNYQKMTAQEKNVFMMRMYDKYIRIFKGKIRELNNEIRRVYSDEYGCKMVNLVNKRADELIQEKAKQAGREVPRNPWFIRKYLWADKENFASKSGVKFREYINPIMRNIVKVSMNNKLIIEERGKLDPTKEYVFVPTHYFTEDIIGLYASLNRQSYVLMGTTDQIENNFLMLAAIILGLFYVDRDDLVSRKECVEKQNRIIDYGSNVVNYVGGSWENSENELQPLSFSGPYRTAKEKNVEIVPVGLYLVREEKKIYVRYGQPMNLNNYDEVKANEIIRDTLASMHFKQMVKHSVPIETMWIGGYGETHNLPYNQHIYYMEQVACEYWGQYWSKPFAKEEIGVRPKKTVDEADVYSFVDNLSREKLLELSKYLADPMVRRYERDERYNIVKYIDENYERLKKENSRVRVKR